jgi:hypothetical protein
VGDVLALSDLIRFLMDLMTDPVAAAEFADDPDAALAERGLQGVTAQDVRDARLELCDAGGASPTGDAYPPSGDDPVREINHTTANYSAAPNAQAVVAQAAAPVSIDDRDTFVFQNDFSDDDTTIVNDSFNSDSSVDNSTDVKVVENDVTAINDSFNSVDNSTDNSVVENDVLAINAEGSFNGAGAPAGDGQPIPVEADGGTGAAPDAPDADPDAGTDETDGPEAPTDADPVEEVPADDGADDQAGSGADVEPEPDPEPAFDPVA